jgi:hypothetical protein
VTQYNYARPRDESPLQPKRQLMKVNWNDIQRPESSGSFPFGGGTITIKQEEIDVWRVRPDALFTVRAFRLWTNKPQYVLANSYELPNEQRDGRTTHMKVTWKGLVPRMARVPMHSETVR